MTCKMCEMPSFFALGLNLGGVGSLPCFTTMNLLAVGREFSGASFHDGGCRGSMEGLGGEQVFSWARLCTESCSPACER